MLIALIYLFLFAEVAPFTRFVDRGPVMMFPLKTENYYTHMIGVPKEFSCIAYGDGNVTYRWYKDDKVC